jgi:hypothetical protein
MLQFQQRSSSGNQESPRRRSRALLSVLRAKSYRAGGTHRTAAFCQRLEPDIDSSGRVLKSVVWVYESSDAGRPLV